MKRAALALVAAVALIGVLATSGVAAPGPPTVIEANPPDTGGGRTDTNVTVTFSEEMQRESINTHTFHLSKRNADRTLTPVAAAVTYNPATKKATLDPESPLEPADYVAQITQRARNLEGVSLDQDPAVAGDQNMLWRFKITDTPVDPTPLKVAGWRPYFPDVARPPDIFRASFSEKVKPATVNATTFKLVRVNADGTTTPVEAAVSYNAATRTAALDPTADLEFGATYLATVTVGVRDLFDYQLDQDPDQIGNQAKFWRVRVLPDTTYPWVIATTPVWDRPGPPEVPGTVNLTATFSEDMQPATINSTNVMLEKRGGEYIARKVTYDAASRTVTIDPAANLSQGKYVAKIQGQVRDLAGNRLGGYEWEIYVVNNKVP